MSNMTETTNTVKIDQYNDARQAIALGAASVVYGRPTDVAVAVAIGKASWLSDRPSPLYDAPADSGVLLASPFASLVSCPRCEGLGLRQFAVSDGIETEECTSCGGEGEVDRATGDAIQDLLDQAHADADDESWDDGHTWVPTEPPATNQARFHDLLSERIEHHAHVDTSPDAEWKADQFRELLRLARITDASDVVTMLDRLAILERHFA